MCSTRFAHLSRTSATSWLSRAVSSGSTSPPSFESHAREPTSDAQCQYRPGGNTEHNHISEITEPHTQESSRDSRPLNLHDLRSMTAPLAERSLHHCSLRREKIQRAVRQAYHSLEESLLSSQSLSVGHVRTGRPVSDEFGSLISNVRENPRRDSENEQIRILLERQKEQILADYRAETQKHEFQAIVTEGYPQIELSYPVSTR